MSDETALYRIWGNADLLLYIGVSNSFGRRWAEHAKTQPWWDEKRRLTVDGWFDSREDAEAAEAAAIRVEGPKYNKRHNGQQEPESAAESRGGATITLGPGVTPEMAARLDLFDLFSEPRVDEALRIEAGDAYLRLAREAWPDPQGAAAVAAGELRRSA